MEAVEILGPAEVREETARVLSEFVELAGEQWAEEDVEVRSWYHGQPIWYLLERQRSGHAYRVLQATVVREAGRLWIELATHLERRFNDVIELPEDQMSDPDAVSVRRLAVEGLRTADLLTVAREQWDTVAPTDPSGPAGGTDWLRVPLSRALQSPEVAY